MRSHHIILVLLLRSIPHSFAKSSWFSWQNSESEDEISPLVSPIVNRELEASVVAHAWPFTLDNIVCEAWAYHHSDWEFMDALVARLQDHQEAITEISEATQLVKDVTSKPTDKALLEYALSLRAYSPQCELHRGLARQVLLAHETHLVSLDAFVVAGRAMLSDLKELPALAVADLPATDLLPGEVPRGMKDGPVAILYANMTTQSFVEWYKAMVDAELPFVVRHLGHVWYEEVGGTPTMLQGYGVRLDIRNVEYRVFDDRDEQPSETAAMINVTSLSTLSSHFLAGVNVSALGLSDEEALALQAQLYKTHDAQQLHAQIIPPGWNRRQLSLQAAAAVASSSSDILMTLQDVSQNLPSVASTLVHVQVPDELTDLAKNMEGLLSHTNGAALFVNGRRVPIDRPSFNVFELLNMMKDEQAELERLQARLGPYLSAEALVQVQRAWSMGEKALADSDGDSQNDVAVRIDVGRGYKNAVLYVNDIEKDEQYANWPRQVRNMVFAQAMGSPPVVRRNIFTIVAAVDPLFDDDENPGIMLASQLMQGNYPARLGVLIVNQNDLDTCAEWVREHEPEEGVPCPVSSMFAPDSTPDLELMEDLEASTQASFRILSHVIANYGMAASSYLQYWTSSIAQYKARKQDNLSLHDLIMIHGQLMSGMHVMDMEDAISEAMDILKADEEVGDAPSYGKALRFAIGKRVKPGMSFLNGRPIPSADSVGEIFMEEQSHIFKLVMSGDITDTSPKSVYAKLLSGNRVFDRVHPLLTDPQDGRNAYVCLTHNFDVASLLVPQTQKPTEAPEAIFLVEAVLDLDSSDGREFATTFIETMESLPDAEGEGGDVSLAYRILPSTASSATSGLCTILAHASKFEISSLLEILKRDDISQMTAEKILDIIPGMSDDNARAFVISDASACSNLSYLKNDLPSRPYVVANGRIFMPEDAAVKKEDLELLLNIELSQAKGITKLMLPHLSFQGNARFDAIAHTACFLAEQNSKDESHRSDMEAMVLEMEEARGIESNPLRFSWNEALDDGGLKIKVSAVVNPISEPTQRLVPLLRAVRDHLKLPLSVILAPQTVTDDNIPITSYYRFVADPQASPDGKPPHASFSHLPANHILTLRFDVPESWNVQQTSSIQDTDNLRCDVTSGCGDDAQTGTHVDRKDLTRVEYGLKNLLVFGQCYDSFTASPPNGLQLTLSRKPFEIAPKEVGQVEVEADGSVRVIKDKTGVVKNEASRYSDTLVMKNVGYWQLRANPGVWDLNIAPESRGAEIFDIVNGTIKNGKLKVEGEATNNATKTVVVKDFVNRGELLVVKRRPGYEKATLFYEKEDKNAVAEAEVINVFSLATGHLYERFLKIMMLSVTKRTSSKVKFWLFENFLSPTFKESAMTMAKRIGCEVEFVTYKWPEWIRGQSEKQRIIWGYKILFLDVLFPLNVKKIIYVDADQVVRGDLKELWDMDLQGAPYGYTPMCSSRETTLGFQFWRSGFWKEHLGDKPYHISALYVVDLDKFRRNLVGDQLRSIYQQLSADPNSLANLDQDLPNYAQHQVPIFSLPQEWLWCESWCSDDTKATAKTIDLCNNPLHKEPKVSMAKRIISGELFNESWVELDEEVERYEREFLDSQTES